MQPSIRLRYALLLPLLPAVALALVAAAPERTLAQETIGVYFDRAGTIDRLQTSSPDQEVPIYLVLGERSLYSLSGWECRLDIRSRSPLPPVTWSYSGDGRNIAEAPHFVVGLTVPLFGRGPTVLAVGSLVVPSPDVEIEIRILPADNPSLWDELGNRVQAPLYGSPLDPGALVALTPASGCASAPVAVVNDDGAAAAVLLALDAPSLEFGSVAPGEQAVRRATMLNAGDAPAIWSAAAGGPGYLVSAGDGRWGRRAGGRLMPGDSTPLDVLFAPAAAGSHESTLTIEECGGATATIACTGAGSGPADDCLLIPARLDFGPVEVGSSVGGSCTIWNRGAATLELDPVTTCADFVLFAPHPVALGPGESCLVRVGFAPGEAGTRDCAVRVGPAACGELAVTGAGYRASIGCISVPAAIDFGLVFPGVPQEITQTVRNGSEGPLDLLVPAACGPFELTAGAGAHTVAPGQEHTIAVRYSPLATGVDECRLDLGPGACTTIALRAEARTEALNCSFTPGFLDFGRVLLGQTVQASFWILNPEFGLLSIHVPPLSPPFRVVQGEGAAVLAAGDRKQVVVSFSPVQEGDFTRTIDLQSRLCPPFQLRGTGTAGSPLCSVSHTELQFPATPLGLQVPSLGFVIRNLGTGPLSGRVTPECGPFRVTGGAGTFTLGAGQIRPVTVAFAPADTGTFTCQLDLGVNCPAVRLEGTALDRVALCSSSPDGLQFPVTGIGSSQTRSLWIRNPGSLAFAGNVPAACGVFRIVRGAGAFQLAPGAHREVAVLFAPADTGDFGCVLDLGSGLCAPIPISGRAVEAAPVCTLSPAALDFGTDMLGRSRSREIIIRNTGVGLLGGLVPQTCSPFRVTSGAGRFLLAEGSSRHVTVSFAPADTGSFDCLLDLGTDLCAPIQLSGRALQAGPVCEVLTSDLDFGPVALGLAVRKTVTIRNAGTISFQVELPVTCGPFLIGEPGTLDVGPLRYAHIPATFRPLATGPATCEAAISALCGPITLTGEGLDPDGVCSLQPDTLDFGTLNVGDRAYRSSRVTAVGSATLRVGQGQSCGPFRPTAPGAVLTPGMSYSAGFLFAPTDTGEFICEQVLTTSCKPLVLRGRAATPQIGPVCVLEPERLAFEEVQVGAVRDLSFTIRNAGTEPLGGEVASGCAAGFTVLAGAGPYTLAPGESRAVTVRFAPPQVGALACRLPLGAAGCEAIACSGAGVEPPPDSNRIGIFWDSETGAACREAVPRSPVTGYLCILDPTAGVAGWECRLAWEPAADLTPLGWRVMGEGPLVLLEPPEFMVALPVPLPWRTVIPILEMQLLPLGSDPVRFTTRPLLSGGSIPGSACYGDASDLGRLIPLTPVSGAEDLPVAQLNGCPEREDRSAPADRVVLHACRPNPFNPRTTIAFDLPRACPARLEVVDLSGRRLCVLADGVLEAGSHERIWEGRDAVGRLVPSGTYYARLTCGGETMLRRMTLLK